MMVAQPAAAQESVTFGGVPMSVSMPEGLTWHMILDHELSQLSLPESGVIGSIGFVALGAVLGLVPGVATAFEKLKLPAAGATPQVLNAADVATIAVCSGCLMLSLVCLLVAGLNWYRNKGLAGKIRARTKRGFTFTGN